jgi:hypothetical protein
MTTKDEINLMVLKGYKNDNNCFNNLASCILKFKRPNNWNNIKILDKINNITSQIIYTEYKLDYDINYIIMNKYNIQLPKIYFEYIESQKHKMVDGVVSCYPKLNKGLFKNYDVKICMPQLYTLPTALYFGYLTVDDILQCSIYCNSNDVILNNIKYKNFNKIVKEISFL